MATLAHLRSVGALLAAVLAVLAVLGPGVPLSSGRYSKIVPLSSERYSIMRLPPYLYNYIWNNNTCKLRLLNSARAKNNNNN